VTDRPFGIIGVFDTPEAIVAAAQRFRELGFRAFDAYTPFPVEGLAEAVKPARNVLLPVVIATGALAGAVWGYFIQYWDQVLSYPINVGGRPYHSWPAFIVSAFEFTLLFAVTAGFFGMLGSCRLPLLYHPIFESDEIARASRDRFVLCIEARDPQYEAEFIRRVLAHLGAERIAEVSA
jgi:hypothetical protein